MLCNLSPVSTPETSSLQQQPATRPTTPDVILIRTPTTTILSPTTAKLTPTLSNNHMTTTTRTVESFSDQPAMTPLQPLNIPQPDYPVIRTTTTTQPQTQTVLTSSRIIPNVEITPESSDSTAAPDSDTIPTGNGNIPPNSLSPTDEPGKAAAERRPAEEDGGNVSIKFFYSH